MEAPLGKKLAVEMLGTFILTFLGIGSILATAYQSGPFPQLVAVALAHGLGLAIAVTIALAISGGHINPAVTMGMLATGRIKAKIALSYIVAQVAGAFLAALIITLAIPSFLGAPLNWGTPSLAPNINVYQGIALEAVGTFLLVITVFGTTVDPRAPKMGGWGVGLMLAAIIMAIGPFTGAAVNPSVSLGPALASADFTNWFVYWIGPIIGGVIGALLYQYAILDKRKK